MMKDSLGKEASRLARMLLLFAMGTGITACRTPSGTVRADPDHALTVPFIEQQGPNDCGAAALAMLIEYYDGTTDYEHLRNTMTVPALGGTIPALIVAAATEAGYDAAVIDGDPDTLASHLRKALPLIILLGPIDGNETGHFVVATGMNRGRRAIRIHDGKLADRWVTAESFRTRWSLSNYTAIRITKGPSGTHTEQ